MNGQMFWDFVTASVIDKESVRCVMRVCVLVTASVMDSESVSLTIPAVPPCMISDRIIESAKERVAAFTLVTASVIDSESDKDTLAPDNAVSASDIVSATPLPVVLVLLGASLP